MLLAPQPEEKRAIDTRLLLPPMQPGMAAAAQRNLPGRFLRARPAVMHDQSLARETELATATCCGCMPWHTR